MSIVRMVIVGLIVGILARFFYPGPVPLGWLYSIVLGIAGSFFAGFILRAIHPRSGEAFHPAGFIASILGGMLLIWLGQLLGIRF